MAGFKGTVSRDFRLLVFFMNQFPREGPIEAGGGGADVAGGGQGLGRPWRGRSTGCRPPTLPLHVATAGKNHLKEEMTSE
jgi:hypothetical protein